LSQIDLIIHEPARLMIMMILKGAGEADFLYLQCEGEFTRGNLFSYLSKVEEAEYSKIEKKVKGEFPHTVCRLTPKGEAALSAYSQSLVRALQSNQKLKEKGSRGA
jgi:Winged helix DNA-binding domain